MSRDPKNIVCKLTKFVYGLKQVSRQWYYKFHQITLLFGFEMNLLDDYMYHKFSGNPSVSLSPTLTINEKVEHYIRIKTHKPIALRFWVESGVNALCGWAQVSLVLYLPSETPSFINLTSGIKARLKPAQTSAVPVWS